MKKKPYKYLCLNYIRIYFWERKKYAANGEKKIKLLKIYIILYALEVIHMKNAMIIFHIRSLFLSTSVSFFVTPSKCIHRLIKWTYIFIYVYMHKRWNCKYRVGFCYRHLLSFPFQRIYYIWLSLLYFAYSTHLQFKKDLSPSLVWIKQ